MLLDIIRDSLGDDELTTDDIAKRELALDKELIKLIQSACKGDRLARALDLTRLIHHAASIDVAIKVAAFYHLVGLQEKMEMIKEEREAADRLEEARDKRRQRAREFAAVPAARIVVAEPRRPKPFQDFQPPPARHRPGLERATPAPDTSKTASGSRSAPSNAYSADTDLESNLGGDYSPNDHSYGSPSDSKRKRPEEDTDTESQSYSVDISTKRRAIDAPVERPRGNPFARKAGQDNGRNPFAKTVDASKSLHKSDSFFAKVDAVETNKTKGAFGQHFAADAVSNNLRVQLLRKAKARRRKPQDGRPRYSASLHHLNPRRKHQGDQGRRLLRMQRNHKQRRNMVGPVRHKPPMSL